MFLVQAKSSPSSIVIECDDYKNLEEYMLKISGNINDKRYPYPSKDEEFSTFCRNIKTGAKFTKDYTQQCLQQNPSGKSILTIIAYSITQSAKKYCARRNPKIRKEMIQIAKCTNPNRKLLTECFQTYLDRMNLTFKVEPDKNKFPYLCCVTDVLSTCMTEKLRNGNPVCSEEAIDNFQKFFGGAMKNAMNFACENFEDQQDRCQNMIEKQVKLNGGLPHVQWRTPFTILIEFFKTL